MKRKECVNFQLFPPRPNSEDTYARHGNDRMFLKTHISLESDECSKLIFRADETIGSKINISVFES